MGVLGDRVRVRVRQRTCPAAVDEVFVLLAVVHEAPGEPAPRDTQVLLPCQGCCHPTLPEGQFKGNVCVCVCWFTSLPLNICFELYTCKIIPCFLHFTHVSLSLSEQLASQRKMLKSLRRGIKGPIMRCRKCQCEVFGYIREHSKTVEHIVSLA